MRRLLPVAVLFVVLLALVLFRGSGSSDLGTAKDAGELIPLAATPFETKDVARLEVFAPGSATPVCAVVREGERWLVQTPFRAPAHVKNVERLAKILAEAEAELRTDDAAALPTFDLTPERATSVRALAADGRVLAHLAVGATSYRQGAFVRPLGDAAGTRAWVTTSDLRGALGLGRSQVGGDAPEVPKPDSFFDSTFPQVDLARASKVEVTAPGRRCVFERRAGSWRAAEGGPSNQVNAEGLSQVLRNFGSEFRAKTLADPSDLAKLGLAEPKHVVAVTLDDGTVRRVFGAEDREKDVWYVRLEAKQDPDVVYEATEWEAQRLFPSGSGLFEFQSVPVKDEELGRIVVAKGDQRFELVRESAKDDWKIVAPSWPLTPRQTSLKSLGSLLKNVRAVDFLDATALESEEATISYGGKDAPDDALTAIRVGGKAPSGKDRLALLPHTPGRVWVLADSTVDRLVVPPLSLYEPRALHGWNFGDVKAARVARRDGEAWNDAFAVESGEGGAFTLVRGEERKPADADAVRKWLDAVLDAEVREAVGGDGAGAADGGEPTVRIVLVREKGDPATLLLSDEKDGKRTARIGDFAFTTDAADLVAEAEKLAAAAAPPKDEPPKEAEPPEEE
jgi:hypothetical protein